MSSSKTPEAASPRSPTSSSSQSGSWSWKRPGDFRAESRNANAAAAPGEGNSKTFGPTIQPRDESLGCMSHARKARRRRQAEEARTKQSSSPEKVEHRVDLLHQGAAKPESPIVAQSLPDALEKPSSGEWSSQQVEPTPHRPLMPATDTEMTMIMAASHQVKSRVRSADSHQEIASKFSSAHRKQQSESALPDGAFTNGRTLDHPFAYFSPGQRLRLHSTAPTKTALPKSDKQAQRPHHFSLQGQMSHDLGAHDSSEGKVGNVGNVSSPRPSRTRFFDHATEQYPAEDIIGRHEQAQPQCKVGGGSLGMYDSGERSAQHSQGDDSHQVKFSRDYSPSAKEEHDQDIYNRDLSQPTPSHEEHVPQMRVGSAAIKRLKMRLASLDLTSRQSNWDSTIKQWEAKRRAMSISSPVDMETGVAPANGTFNLARNASVDSSAFAMTLPWDDAQHEHEADLKSHVDQRASKIDIDALLEKYRGNFDSSVPGLNSPPDTRHLPNHRSDAAYDTLTEQPFSSQDDSTIPKLAPMFSPASPASPLALRPDASAGQVPSRPRRAEFSFESPSSGSNMFGLPTITDVNRQIDATRSSRDRHNIPSV